MAPASTTTADVTSTYDAVSFAWRPGPLTATGSAVQLAPNHPNHTTANSRDATMRKRERPQRGRGRGFRPERRVRAAIGRARGVDQRYGVSLDSREAGCARLLCCPGSDDTMKALVTDGSVTLRTADLN